MKNFGKKMVVSVLLLSIAVASTACGGRPTDSHSDSGTLKRPAGTKIVIYAGGSSEFSWVEGSEESEVIEAVEQAYYEDTGISLNFEVSYLGLDMHTKLTSEVAGGTQVDIAISHTRGGVGIDDFAIAQNLYYDLGDLLEDYGPNVLKYTEGSALDSLTTYDNKVIGIPSVISPYKFGILVRKDYMERCGFTDDPEKALTEFKDGVNYELVDNLDSFEKMCVAINTITGNSYAVTGAPWDLEKVLTLGAYTDSGYFTFTKRTNNGIEEILPGYATDEYKDVLGREYKWATTGVVSKEANSILLEQAESNFISGNTGVFVQDPTVQHLIQVARRTKTANPEAEFTVLGPLTASADTTKKGFMRNTEATFAAVVLSPSKNAREIVRFLNWMFSEKANYELCRYGVEGVHWVDNGDGTYSYPQGKEEYLTRSPYSGILALVENQNISDLTYAGYSDEEKQWIALAGNKNNYIENDVVDYLFPMSQEMSQLYSNAINTIYNAVVVAAWTGQSNPLAETDGVTAYDKQIRAFRSNAQAYINYITNAYHVMAAKRK